MFCHTNGGSVEEAGEASKYNRRHAVGTVLWRCHSLVLGLYHSVNDEDVLLTFMSNLPMFDMSVAEVDLMIHSWIFKQNVMEFMTDQNSKLRYTISKRRKPIK